MNVSLLSWRKPSIVKLKETAHEPKFKVSELAQLKGRQVQLATLISTLSEIEADAKAEATKELHTVEQRIAGLEAIGQMVKKHGKRFQLLDLLGPLSWRDRKGWPKLAVYFLTSPRFRITTKIRWFNYRQGDDNKWWRSMERTYIIEPDISSIRDCFGDVHDRLYERSQDSAAWAYKVGAEHSDDFWWESTFKGLIPAEVKVEIARVQNEAIFQQVFIVAEVNQAKLGTTDPLVVGYDGYNFWLIKAFDTTNLEALIADEFAQKV